MSSSLSIIIIAGNEESIIQNALVSAQFADEIVLVAANSTDNTKKIAKLTCPDIKIIETNDEYGKNFAKWRNLGLDNATGQWLFYLDCDEVITPELQKEIIDIINQPVSAVCYAVPRANHFLGQRVRHGGTYPDYVRRLFFRSALDQWQGFLHEQPNFVGTESKLTQDLLHFTHRDLTSMLTKTINWTEAEAQALYDHHHPQVVWWRFIRMILTKIYERLIKQQMYKDGTVGWISVIFEAFDTFIIYARLWELQQKNK